MQFLGLSGALGGGTALCPERSGRPDLPVCTPGGWPPAPIRALVPADPARRDPAADLAREAVRAADPHLVIVDRWNETWPDGLGAWFEEVLGHEVELWDWNVRTFRDTLEQGLRLGRRFGVLDRAMRLMGDRETELLEWRARTGLHRRAPDAVLDPVSLVTSLDPPAAAAGWAHDVVDRAAARLLAARSGEPAVSAEWSTIVREGSVAVVSLPARSIDETAALLGRAPAAREALARAGRVALYDGRGTLDSAGPGLHEAILDLLAFVHGLGPRGGRVTEWSG